jgi:homoserine kinase
MTKSATVFAPGSVGNVGPGFDVLGLAVDGVGDTITVELTSGPDAVTVDGRDASLLPTDPLQNASAISARAMLEQLRISSGLRVHVHKGLSVSGGMGGSAASSVGGALAAALAAGVSPTSENLMRAALAGESAVAGHHLDNIAPCVLGGLTLVRDAHTLDVVRVPLPRVFFVAWVSPRVLVETRTARAILPSSSPRSEWLHQVAHTSALVLAFATGDADLMKRALNDGYAEPRRASLIPGFARVKRAALDAGALGGSISGSGPAVFALAENEHVAQRAALAMHEAFGEHAGSWHVGPVSTRGARAL